jgi:hypothetical protein
MLSRSTLTIAVGALAILGFGACKTMYSDTYSYKKNSFQPPVVKEPEIKPPAVPLVPEGGVLPQGAGGLPGAPAPEGGALPGIPGIPGAAPAAPEGVPGVPGAAPAAPAVPGVPAVPGAQ